MSARDVLRAIWSSGVTVTTRPDGSLALVPSQRVTPDVLQLASTAKPEIAAVITELPAPGCCPICGDSTGWPNTAQLHCVACALLAAERLGLHPRDISKQWKPHGGS